MKGFVPVYKLYVEMFCIQVICKNVYGQTLFSYPYLRVLSKYKNVSKNNITSSETHIIV